MVEESGLFQVFAHLPGIVLAEFLAILDRALAQQGWVRIAEINRAINLDIRPMDDMAQYGVVDLWATPLMTFSSNAGDCEDYAIAKYVALREIGIAEDDLRLVVAHDRGSNEDHAVAAVRYEGRWLILDNRTLEMRQDVDIAALEPLFVIDRDGVKRMTAAAPKPANLMVSASRAAVDLQFFIRVAEHTATVVTPSAKARSGRSLLISSYPRRTEPKIQSIVADRHGIFVSGWGPRPRAGRLLEVCTTS